MTERPRFARMALEGLVIVASILLAFGIEAWWQGKLEDRERNDLVEDLLLDFETTGERLDAKILRGDSVLTRGNELFRLVQVGEEVSLDSLRSLMRGFTSAIQFEPTTSAYEAAVGSGRLALLDSRDFLTAAAEYRRALNFYGTNFDVAGELFYFGPQASFRSELGSLGVLERDPDDCFDAWNCPFPRSFLLTGPELFAYLQRRDVHGGLENIHNANRNIVTSLEDARTAVDDILDALRELDEG